MRVLWVGLLLLASACGGAETPPDSPCEAEFASGEFGSNYAMTAVLSYAPAVGETATLTVAACAKEAARTVVSVTLSDGVEWRTPPDGTVVNSRPAPYGDGCETVATGEWDLAAMTPFRLVGKVVATRTGTAELTGSAGPTPDGGPGPGNAAYVYITVGNEYLPSHFGYPELDNESGATSATRRPPPVCD